MAYRSPFSWPKHGRVQRPEFPAHHIRRARVDCTDHNGHVIESNHISAPSQAEIQPVRAELYAWLTRMHGRKGIYIFFNDLSLKQTETEEAA
jgi:hypothetical protein